MRRKNPDFQFEEPFEPITPEEPPPPGPTRTTITPDLVDPTDYVETFHAKETAQEIGTKHPDWDPVFVTDKIVEFCEKIGSIPNYRFYRYQREFLRRLVHAVVGVEAEELTVMVSRQGGKTEALCRGIIGMMILLPALAQVFPQQLDVYRDGFWVGVFAPLDWQVQTDVIRLRGLLRARTTQSIMADPELGKIKEVTKHFLSNGSQLYAHTANPLTDVESKTLHLAVVEEAQGMDRLVVQKSISPMLAAVAGTMLKIGTPNFSKCDFLDSIQRNKRRQRNRKGWQHQWHFEFDYRICQAANPRYKKFIEKEKERLGEDSDAFRASYGCEWILERRMFITPVDLDALEDPKREAVSSFIQAFGQQAHTLRTVAGLDVGKSIDSTVLTIGLPQWAWKTAEGFFHVQLLSWFEWLGDDHESQYHQIVPILREFRVRRLAIDSTGMGDAISDRYHHNLPDVEVLPVVFSTPTKSDLFKVLDREIRGRRLSVPAGPQTRKTRTYRNWRGQMEDAQKEYRGSYLVVQAPKDDRDAHDDYPCSMALMAHAAYVDVFPEVQQISVGIQDFRGRNTFLRA